MVMHARKLPRLNDGYIDRNQAHPYEGSAKYASKSSFNERYNDRIRESPTTGNSSNYGKTESPDTKNSPRCHNKSVYTPRAKERDREHHEAVPSKSPIQRDRSIKVTSGNGKDQQAASTMRRSTDGSVGTHRTNHDRSHADDKEKRIQVGDWSEHISSSGKKYYYNCKTEVSQWEKPKEWIEWEKQQGLHKPVESNRSKEKVHDRQLSVICTKASEKHSIGNAERSSSHNYQQQTNRPHGELVHPISAQSKVITPSIRNADHGGEKTEPQSTPGDKCDRYKGIENRRGSEASQTHDMDISPGSGDTPTSSQPETYHLPTVTHSSHISNQTAPQISQAQLLSPSQVTLANLPRLISQLAGTKGLPNLSELSPHDALRTIQQALQLTKQVTSLAQSGNVNRSPLASLTPSENPIQKSHSPSLALSHISHNSLSQNSHSQTPPVSHNSSYPQYQQALPAPSSDGKMETERGHVSPSSDYSSRSSRHGSPTSSISSLHSLGGGPSSLVSAVLKPVVPSLPPSLANYYCENYISHVTGWQADHAERQASRYSDEAHTLGSLNCTQVSAELKMARSLVRLAEIQATLQEQRIMFLSQQITEIEEWKTRNTFMPDT